MKAVVLSHAQIGGNTIIGACALVSEYKHIPEGVLAVGIPAKVARPLKPEEAEKILSSSTGYYERAKTHGASIFTP